MSDQKATKAPEIERDVEFAWKANQKGNALHKAGHHKLAEHFFRVAISCDSYCGAYVGNLIGNLLSQKRHQEAEAFGREHYDAHKGDGWFLRNYAFSLIVQDKCQEALPLFQELERKEKCGEGAVFEFNYAYCLAKTGKAHEAEERFKKSNKLDENGADYDWLIFCFQKNKNFCANENFMVERLFVERPASFLSLSCRRYWLAEFYKAWAETLEKSGQPDEAKEKWIFARKYAGQAVEFASLKATDKEDKDLKSANILFAEIDKKIATIENGFDPPEPFQPETP